MTKTFCTIITADYFPKALTLYKSLQSFDAGIQLQVLIVNNKDVPGSFAMPEGIKLIPVKALAGFSLADDLYRKYAHTNMDFFRWSMKPVFITYLLENKFEKVLYIDCDMYFFNNYDFLFSWLDESDILLTPNWINTDPMVDKESFFSLFTSGFFSAGFIGANKEGLPALKWWAEACHFMMGEHIQHGIRDDQKYLDIFPVKFEKAKIIRHRGCNIGAWNYDECKRVLVNGEVLINGEFPIIFIHFDGMLIQGILRGYDKLLTPHYLKYKEVFSETGAGLGDFIGEVDEHVNAGVITRLKWRIQLKTRVKRALYKLSQKL